MGNDNVQSEKYMSKTRSENLQQTTVVLKYLGGLRVNNDWSKEEAVVVV